MSADPQMATGLIEQALACRDQPNRPVPFLLGISGAQGSGKSTVAELLRQRCEARGLRTAILSLDDLYLGRKARADMAKAVHPLFATRGVPGTHDLGLGHQVLDGLAGKGPVRLPRFDKALDEPLPEEEWPCFAAPADLILFEGWCVGARPQNEEALVPPLNALERSHDGDGVWRRAVNERLAGDYRRLFDRLDMLVLLAAPTFEVVARWRTEQETALKLRLLGEGRDTARSMSATEIARFVQFYERITRHILSEMPSRADLVIDLDEHRAVRD